MCVGGRKRDRGVGLPAALFVNAWRVGQKKGIISIVGQLVYLMLCE